VSTPFAGTCSKKPNARVRRSVPPARHRSMKRTGSSMAFTLCFSANATWSFAGADRCGSIVSRANRM
jgi:hypothetical protein